MSTVYTMRLQSPNWDGHTFTDAQIASGQTRLTSNQVGFIAADVGLPIIVQGAGVGGKPLYTTIGALVSATQVDLNAAASTTVTAAGAHMGHGYQVALPCVADQYDGDSMAAVLALFNAKNAILDLKQYREVVVLQGFLTPEAAAASGFANAVQMRDELRRIRASAGPYGLLNPGAAGQPASAQSWLQEDGTSAHVDGSGGNTWGSTTLPLADQDSSTNRGIVNGLRLVYDQYWNPNTGAYSNLFVYGTVAKVSFGPRPGATTQLRIPFSVTFLAGSVKVG